MKRFIYVYVLLFLLISSCEKEAMVLIDAELQFYVDLFEEEAMKRNQDIHIDEIGIHASIEDIEGAVVGQCHHKENAPNAVLLDQKYWDNANEDERLFIVFHELGHCILKKDHNDQTDASGYCLSIMHSSTEVCDINFNSTQRDAYFDELFSN